MHFHRMRPVGYQIYEEFNTANPDYVTGYFTNVNLVCTYHGCIKTKIKRIEGPWSVAAYQLYPYPVHIETTST